MPNDINFSQAPFNALTTEQQADLSRHTDIVYFRSGERILHEGQVTESVFIIIKGGAEERSDKNDEVHAHYTNDDIFDLRSPFSGVAKHSYYSIEDTLCHVVPTPLFLSLYQENPHFAAYFDTNLAKKKALLDQAHQQKNLAEFILTKINDDTIQPCITVLWTTPLKKVTQLLKENAMDALFVELNQYDPRYQNTKDPLPIGIITRTDLLHALVLHNHKLDHPVGPIATYPMVHIQKQDYLFNAMTKMTRHHVKRVAVFDNSKLVGMLDMTQILSRFSTHSHVLTLRIARAQSVEELRVAANTQTQLVETLINNGIRTRFIMELVSIINEQIIEKAFSLVVPKNLYEHTCLLVMGSEGRGEQILKTDQDNALIIKNGFESTSLQSFMEQFSHTLQQLGYPLCKGKVMVSNSAWVKTEQQWQHHIKQICHSPNSDNMMNLAILSDSHAIAGNKDLLLPIKQHILNNLKENEWVLNAFARPALQFKVPLTLFGHVKNKKEGINIKQGGIFPIVHGVRALSLEQGIGCNNTFLRIEALKQNKVLEPSTADNLTEALKLFFKWRLRHQLQDHQHKYSNHIHTDQLDRTERDLLRHALHVVKKFKEWLGYHYQIRD